ncbi:MAG: GIY-YIG nuclease family protein [Bacteroidia bacterium]
MYVYILKCSDDSYYVGVTNNLEMRFEQHVQGVIKNCYTYKRRPLEIVFYEIFNGPISPIAFEKKLKGWSKAKKTALINNNWSRLKELSECKNETNFKIQAETLRLRSV